MKFTTEVLDTIDKNKFDLLRKRGRHGVGAKLTDSEIAINDMRVVNVEHLTHLIEDLTDLREAIKTATGIEF